MAYKLFNGNDWLAASFAPTTLPASNDTVICPESVTGNKTDASGNAHDIDLDLLETHPGFRGDFGASGAPIKTAADLVVHKGSGAFYYECTDDGATGLTTDEVRIEAANAGVVVVLSTDASATKGDYKDIIINRGTVTFDASIVFAASPLVKIGSIGNAGSDANLTIVSGAPTLATLEQVGGLSTLHNVITDLRIVAGICFKETAKAVNITIFGGTCVYNHAAASGDVVLVEVHAGGTFDMMRKAVEASGVKSTIDKVIAHPGSRVLYDTNMHTITDFVDLRTSLA